MKKISKILFSRVFMVALAIALQLGWLFLFLYRMSFQFTYVNLGLQVVAVMLVLYITTTRSNPSSKLTWTFLILFLPIVGIVLYFVFGRAGLTKRTREKMDAVNRRMEPLLEEHTEYRQELERIDVEAAKQSEYISKWAHFPLYKDTVAKYYDAGEAMFPDMLQELEQAKHYIFLELLQIQYFL